MNAAVCYLAEFNSVILSHGPHMKTHVSEK